jgi:hypothetical protein
MKVTRGLETDTLMDNYDLQPTDELLGLLEVSGRAPDPDLIRACLARGKEVTPTLLAWLAAEEDWEEQDSWDEDDPRWYRTVHAALILIELREPAALPIFRRIMAEDDGYLLEWIATELPAYGPLATDWAIDILRDPSLPLFSRISAAELLSDIGRDHPDEQARILPALRGMLPQMDASGKVQEPDDDAWEDQIELWSWAAYALGQLRDTASQPVITALYHQELIDLMVMGDLEDYLQMFGPDAQPAVYDNKTYDILATYESLQKQAIAEQAKRAENPPPVRTEPVYHMVADTRPYVRTTPKIGRNDPCPCGSGRKYKHCHGKK